MVSDLAELQSKGNIGCHPAFCKWTRANFQIIVVFKKHCWTTQSIQYRGCFWTRQVSNWKERYQRWVRVSTVSQTHVRNMFLTILFFVFTFPRIMRGLSQIRKIYTRCLCIFFNLNLCRSYNKNHLMLKGRSETSILRERCQYPLNPSTFFRPHILLTCPLLKAGY